ncbi:magnesium/cobalt transporter CorA [Fusibacter sp. 3D3]|uniref:magnesium/cobalt transporter CorA n=1 Tax=Fusibacter sp. 3D3 TaxID=1048380 RepID=UPI0008535EDB|nr:magnesium/cobalt transporter CorA [Fusibacter sp. 3D3]GAU77803.1 magnesium and cobalt transport protein CorA [Fusibacter sp. 3D3]
MKKSKRNLPPGTMVYTGEYTNEPLKLELFVFSEAHHEYKVLKSLDEMHVAKGVKWLNVVGLSHIDALNQIAQHYQINDMVMEDIVNVSHRSKIEFEEKYLFGIFKMIYLGRDDVIFKEHLSIIQMPEIIITFQERQEDVFDAIRQRIRMGQGKIRSNGSDYLFYALLDAIVDHQLDVMNHIQDQVDELEKQIIDEDDSLIESLYHMRKDLLMLKTAVMPLDDIITTLLSETNHYFLESTKLYLRDVSDHTTHLKENMMMYREIISALFETHQTNVSNNMNKVMTTLTIFSATFIPLSFFAGVFGMNFKYMPGLGNRNSFLYFSIFCLVTGVGMLGYFRRR